MGESETSVRKTWNSRDIEKEGFLEAESRKPRYSSVGTYLMIPMMIPPKNWGDSPISPMAELPELFSVLETSDISEEASETDTPADTLPNSNSPGSASSSLTRAIPLSLLSSLEGVNDDSQKKKSIVSHSGVLITPANFRLLRKRFGAWILTNEPQKICDILELSQDTPYVKTEWIGL
jgi:hypothetical protein